MPFSATSSRDVQRESPCLSLLPVPPPSLCGLGRARAGSPCRLRAAFLCSPQHLPRRARSKVFAPVLGCRRLGAPLRVALCILSTGILMLARASLCSPNGTAQRPWFCLLLAARRRASKAYIKSACFLLCGCGQEKPWCRDATIICARRVLWNEPRIIAGGLRILTLCLSPMAAEPSGTARRLICIYRVDAVEAP